MESPLNIGDTTANSISHRLNDTHLDTTCTSTIFSASYSGQRVVQLNLKLTASSMKTEVEASVMRRLQDSYVNISQLLSILLELKHFTTTQINNFLVNEILTSSNYSEGNTAHRYDDLRKHDNSCLRGIWISYDKAVSLALKFDIYEFTKKLFLFDVHDYDKLPKASKRLCDDDMDDSSSTLMGSPTKKPKIIKDEPIDMASDIESIKNIVSQNTNFPFTLPMISKFDNEELVSEVKIKFGEIFKRDEEAKLTFNDVKIAFQKFLGKKEYSILDIPLDQNGQTALHFASALASSALISSFIKLGLTSPIRGNSEGESPLISTLLVTNAMEKGNFLSLLKSYLWPNLWLYSNKNWSFLHYLATQKKFESSKFYMTKILEYIIPNEKDLSKLISVLINLQDDENGNTCLHLAAENDSRWFIKIFLELKADVNIKNKMGVKPIDYNIVKDIANNSEELEEEHIFELIRSNLEFLDKRIEISDSIENIEEPKPEKDIEDGVIPDGNSSNKIFRSIQDLLANTNNEYEAILTSKKQQIIQLNKSLHDSTIVTANNRFLSKKISEKMLRLDNLKLQISNISDKLQLSKREIPYGEVDESENADADESFIIGPMHERLIRNESVDDLKTDQMFLDSLPSATVLQARIKAYQEINRNIENELGSLLNYSELTLKFKKVVSICTGVDINEVDELLDGLLEAVEGQQ